LEKVTKAGSIFRDPSQGQAWIELIELEFVQSRCPTETSRGFRRTEDTGFQEMMVK
jgi:hypothetical protein